MNAQYWTLLKLKLFVGALGKSQDGQHRVAATTEATPEDFFADLSPIIKRFLHTARFYPDIVAK